MVILFFLICSLVHAVDMPLLNTKIISVQINFTDSRGTDRTIPVSSRIILPLDWNRYISDRSATFSEVQSLEHNNIKLNKQVNAYKIAFDKFTKLDEREQKFIQIEKELNEREIRLLNRENSLLRNRARDYRNELRIQKILGTVVSIGLAFK